MLNQKPQTNKKEAFINIRKLAALDIVFHGARLILIEFVLAVLVCGIFGVLSLAAFLRTPDHPIFSIVIGLVLCWIALNYVPLLLYSIDIVRHNSAQKEVAYELEHKDIYGRKYSRQSLILLLLPLVVPILVIVQEGRKRTYNKN